MDKALQTQLANIEKRTGKSLDELSRLVRSCGHTSHGAIRDWLKRELGMGHGDANTLVHVVLQSAPGMTAHVETEEAAADRIYAGQKAALRPIHDAVMTAVRQLGSFEIAPKKTYVSLRRKKQFAMVGPATNSRVEVGLNLRGVDGTERLEALPPGGMCQYRVRLTSVGDVDRELINWICQAYDQSA